MEPRWKIHGHASYKTRTSEYIAWQHMKRRCYEQSNPEYHRYGGRGITVCDRWLSSYVNFISDMGRKPTSGHSLDRINLDGNYETSNCRWATRIQQMRNTSRTRFATILGQRKSLPEWQEITGIPAATIASRIESGWPAEKLLSNRKHEKLSSTSFRMLTFGGATLRLKEMAELHGLTPKALSTRLSRGMSLEQALTQPMQKRIRPIPEIQPQL